MIGFGVNLIKKEIKNFKSIIKKK